MKANHEQKNILTYEGWDEVSHEMQSQIKEFSEWGGLLTSENIKAIVEAFNQLTLLIDGQSIGAHASGEPLIITAEMIQLLRFIRVKILLADLCRQFIIFVNFFYYAEEISSIPNIFFQALPRDIHEKVFGDLDKGLTGYIDLNTEKKTKKILAMVNVQGYLMFKKSNAEVDRLLHFLDYNLWDWEKSQIKKILTKSPELMLERICFRRLFCIYNNITILEYSLLNLYRNHSCFFLIQCLAETPLDEPLRKLLRNQLEKYKVEGIRYFYIYTTTTIEVREKIKVPYLILLLKRLLERSDEPIAEAWKKLKQEKAEIPLDSTVLSRCKNNFFNASLSIPGPLKLEWIEGEKPMLKIAFADVSKIPEFSELKLVSDFLETILDTIKKETLKKVYLLLQAPSEEPVIESSKTCSIM